MKDAPPHPGSRRASALGRVVEFGPVDEELVAVAGSVQAIAHAYRRLDPLPEPKPVVKSPRAPGSRPKPEENLYGA